MADAGMRQETEELARLRREYPGWRIWISSMDGLWHAHRNHPDEVLFVESPSSQQRFHVTGRTAADVTVHLALQAVVDAKLRAEAASDE